MVNLTKIYTRTGDGGQTRLGTGDAVPKADARVEAFGEVDETNAAVGLASTLDPSDRTSKLLAMIRNDLFDLGADLCVPPEATTDTTLRVTQQQVARLEAAIDEVNEELESLRSFVLPGGTRCSAALHVARAVCRRAERRVWRLIETEGPEAVNEQVAIYLNRLSDLLFVLSRAENAAAGIDDVLWQPGGSNPA